MPPIDAPDNLALTDIGFDSLGTVSIAANQTTGSLQFTLDRTVSGLGIQLRSVTQVPTVTVQGGVSGTLYLATPIFANTGYEMWVRMNGAADNPITVTVTVPAALSGTQSTPVIDVIAMHGTGVMNVAQSPQDVWSVAVVSQPPALPVPLQVAVINNALAAGATATIVAGVGGKVVTVLGYTFISAGAAGATGAFDATLEDSTGANVFAYISSFKETAAGQVAVPLSFQLPVGLSLPSGRGVRVHAAAGNGGTGNFHGAIYYIQK